MVLRAGRCEYGEGTDGTVKITAVQDVFSLSAATWLGVEPSGFVPPPIDPVPIVMQRVEEATFRDLVIALGISDAEKIDATTGYLAAYAASPLPMAYGFELQTKVGSSAFARAGDSWGTWSSGGALAAPLSMTATQAQLDLTTAFALEFAEAGAALIGDEIVRVDDIDPATGILTIARGCVDTVPAVHPAGTVVWLVEDAGAADETEYVAGTTVTAALLTSAPGGILSIAEATPLSKTIQGRAARPYPPGNFRINGQREPASVAQALDLTLTWNRRDRITQADLLIDSSQGNIGQDITVAYKISIYGNGTLVRTENLGGLINSWTYDQATESADGERFTTLRITLESVKDNVSSWQKHDWTITRL